jgi:hypothetical protein
MEVVMQATLRSDGGIEVSTYWNGYNYWTVKDGAKILIFKDTLSSKRLIVLLNAFNDVLARDVVVYKTKKQADEQFELARKQGQLLVS